MPSSTSVVVVMIVFVALALAESSTTTVKVTVNVLYPSNNLPEGATMFLRGSAPLSWASGKKMQRVRVDAWSVEFDVHGLNSSVPLWAIEVKAIVDDDESMWQLGANHHFSMTYKQQTALTTVYPYFYTAKGATHYLKDVFSPQLNNSRNVWLYIPPALIENTLRVEENVLIMHDGENLQDEWGVLDTLNTHIVQGDIDSVFVIGPDNTLQRTDEYTYSKDPTYGGGKGDLYLDFLEKTLLPLVTSKYSISTTQSSLGIAGSSLGGLISCYAGVTRPHVYSKIGCFSSSFWWNLGDFQSTILPRLTSTNGATQTFYIDSGDQGDTDDGAVRSSQVATGFLMKDVGFEIGRNFYYFIQRGAEHNEYWWASRFPQFMQWLYYYPGIWNYPDNEVAATLHHHHRQLLLGRKHKL